MTGAVVVSAPSRLHFGLLRFGQDSGPSFGGLGMMIRRPRAVVALERADAWSVDGPSADRALAAAQRALRVSWSRSKPEALRVVVRSAIPSHRGLGGGTQLALAVAAGVRRVLNLPPGMAEQLAQAAGRGERSAVGSHGFVQGGLLWETGLLPGAKLGRLKRRVELPGNWRIVLAAPRDVRGLSGTKERQAFSSLPPVAAATVARLTELAEVEVLPAAERGDLEAFGEGVYQYGRLAGGSFAAVQGGCYASADVAALVAELRGLGARAVGQSSWGPTVFAIVAGEPQAADLAAAIRERPRWADYELEVSAPDNQGAVVTVEPSDAPPAEGTA
jgi:beta-RFAP synthase